MNTGFILILFMLALCALAALCGPARASSRGLARRDGQAISLAAALIVASSLLARYSPRTADNLLVLGGLVVPPLIAAVAGRWHKAYSLLTVIAGLAFWIAVDYSRQAIPDLPTLFDRYSFPAVILGGASLATGNLLKQYTEQKTT